MITKLNFFIRLVFVILIILSTNHSNVLANFPIKEKNEINYSSTIENSSRGISSSIQGGMNSNLIQIELTPTPIPTETPDPSLPSDGPPTEEERESPLPRSVTSYYVNIDTGSNSNSCLSAVEACQNIQEAINKAASGDRVYVTNGTYSFSSNPSPNVVIVNKTLLLSGGWNSDFTTQTGASIVDGGNANNGLLITSGSVTVENFIIQNSTSGNSGAIYIVSGSLLLRRSTLKNNIATNNGGGIFVDSGTVTVINSTITNNTAGSAGGGIYTSNNPDGVFVAIRNSTIAFNTSPNGGGIRRISNNGTFNVTNSIIANNSAATSGVDCNGSINIVVYSIIENMDGCTIMSPSNNLHIDPIIDNSLTTNMQIHALLSESPAINGGDPSFANCQAVDQRGVSRPQFGRCDIGAHEYDIVGEPSVIQVSSGSPQKTIVSTVFGNVFIVLVTDEFGIPVSGETVTFTAPVSGASGIFTDTASNVTTAITNASGIATASVFTANSVEGVYTVDATVLGIVDPAQFQLQNYVPIPTTISVNAGSPQTALTNTSYSTPLRVLVADQFLKPMQNVTVTFTAPSNGASGTFANTANNVTTTVTNSGGIAIASTLTANNVIGEFIVEASVVGIGIPVSFQLLNYSGMYVSTSGSDSYSCATPSLPCATINGAISKAKNGDTIYITEGVYTSTGVFVVTISKDIILSGGWDNTFSSQTGYTTIDGENERRGVSATSNIVIDRFTIINGFSTNTFNQGAGFEGKSGNYTINNSSIHSNTGHGIHFSGILNINNSTISNNTEKGIYAPLSGTANINNSTITLNGATGIFSNPQFSTIYNIKNSIISNNKGGTDFFPPYPQQDCYGNINSQGNNIIGIITPGCSITGATNNFLNTNPQLGTFLPFAGYHPLKANSPAINAGNSATCYGTSDQRGISRVGTCDIGSYEYVTPNSVAGVYLVSGDEQNREINYSYLNPLIVVALDNVGSPVPGVEVTFTAPSSGASGIFVNTNTNQTTIVTDGGGTANSQVFTANNNLGQYIVLASVSGFSPIEFHLENIGWYVSQSGNDSNSCTTPSSPCATINAAISKAVAGDTIFINSDTYTSSESSVVSIPKNIILSGGWNSTFSNQSGFTTINGQGARRGILVSSTFNLTAERLNIINTTGGVVSDNSLIIINNSIISNNNGTGTSNYGGIYLLYGSLILNNSLVSNTSGDAGISTWNGSITVNNSTISNNINPGDGGGIRFAGDHLAGSQLIINNSTIAYNSASQGGGIYRYHSFYRPMYIKNSIIANNQATFAGPDCWIRAFGDHQKIVSNNNIFSNLIECSVWSFGGDWVGNPQINPILEGVLGYHAILPGSIAINTGDSASCLSTDQLGFSRPQGPKCDIGAVEYIDNGPPNVWSISRKNASPTSSFTVDFIVQFTKPVMGVDANDFNITETSEVSGAFVTAVSGSGNIYTVTVNTGLGNGTIRLNVIDDDSIIDNSSQPLGGTGVGNGNFINDEVYSITKRYSALSAPKIPYSQLKFLSSDATPTLPWSNVQYASGYKIVIAQDKTFNNIILDEVVFGINFTPIAPLADGIYYWRVYSLNGNSQPGKTSVIQTLTIDTTPPTIPTLTSPMDGAELKRSPILRWTRVSGGVIYELQVSTSSDFSNPTTYTLRTNSRNLPALPDGVYYWRVKVKDSAGNWSNWSVHREFEIDR